MKTGQLVVKSHRPWQRRGIIIGAWLMVATVTVAAYELGHYQAGYKRIEFAAERERLETALAQQAATNARLGEQITILERTQLIDSKAYQSVRDELKLLQGEILELREEVEFYRGIVSPVERQAGLNIQSLNIQSAGEERLYHYDLVMSQVLKNDRYVSGVVKLYLQGVQEGEPQTLEFADLSPNDSVTRNFRFRYFQRMEGDIRLPAGFVPRNVMVEMSPQGRKQVSKSFAWSAGGG